jgi:hypothetical protein
LVDYHDVYGEAAVGKPTAAYFNPDYDLHIEFKMRKKRRENRE